MSEPPPDAAELGALLGAWPLGELQSVTRVGLGASNWVYRVVADKTSGFLRVYRRATVEVVRREHALIERVRRQGLPAPAPRLTSAGLTFSRAGGRLCALYERADGLQVEPTALGVEHARGMGRALARLHEVLRGLDDVGYVRWELRWDAADWVARLRAIESAISAAGPSSEVDAWALERARAQRAWLGDPACEHQYAPRYSRQVVHGDFQHDNLFFRGAEVSGIVDWEQAAYMPRAYELVRATAFAFRLDPALTRACVAAYRDVAELGEAELLDGARAWGCFSDHHVWPLEEAYLHGNAVAKRYVPREPFRPFAQAWGDAGLA